MNYQDAIQIVSEWALSHSVVESLFNTLAEMDSTNCTVEEARARDFLFDHLAAGWGK